MNHSSRSRVLTLQRLDIEERSSVLQIRESIIGGVFRFGERRFFIIGDCFGASYDRKGSGRMRLARFVPPNSDLIYSLKIGWHHAYCVPGFGQGRFAYQGNPYDLAADRKERSKRNETGIESV